MSDKRITPASQLARDIFDEILPLVESNTSFLKTYDLGEDAGTICERIRSKLRLAGVSQKVTITNKNGVLYIGTRQPSRRQQLQSMIRRLAMSTDDERLYEEALALVEVI